MTDPGSQRRLTLAATVNEERVSIPTVERFWLLLTGIVDELSAGKR